MVLKTIIALLYLGIATLVYSEVSSLELLRKLFDLRDTIATNLINIIIALLAVIAIGRMFCMITTRIAKKEASDDTAW